MCIYALHAVLLYYCLNMYAMCFLAAVIGYYVYFIKIYVPFPCDVKLIHLLGSHISGFQTTSSGL